jgi:hypothetical protein
MRIQKVALHKDNKQAITEVFIFYKAQQVLLSTSKTSGKACAAATT